jgi:hypothetical protein
MPYAVLVYADKHRIKSAPVNCVIHVLCRLERNLVFSRLAAEYDAYGYFFAASNQFTENPQ